MLHTILPFGNACTKKKKKWNLHFKNYRGAFLSSGKPSADKVHFRGFKQYLRLCLCMKRCQISSHLDLGSMQVAREDFNSVVLSQARYNVLGDGAPSMLEVWKGHAHGKSSGLALQCVSVRCKWSVAPRPHSREQCLNTSSIA